MTTTTVAASGDERLKQTPFVTRLMRRPELGALAGLILIIIFFSFAASGKMFSLAGVVTFMSPASQLGILAIGAAMLMIAGEFDLSVGSMVAFAGLIFGVALAVLGLPPILAIIVTIAAAAAVGAVNGQIVQKTGLPSFIVTLAFLFILRGMTLDGLDRPVLITEAGRGDVGQEGGGIHGRFGGAESMLTQLVMDLLRKLAAEQDAAIIAVTHDEKIFDRFDYIFQKSFDISC